MNSNLTSKETQLLEDLKSQEKLCVEKYRRYAAMACNSELRDLFNSIGDVEMQHYKTLCDMTGAACDNIPASNIGACECKDGSYSDEQCKNTDAFFCSDMLTTEKHASSLYDTCIFEFVSPQNRDKLNHIQKEEQEHGEKIFSYMQKMGMYNVK